MRTMELSMALQLSLFIVILSMSTVVEAGVITRIVANGKSSDATELWAISFHITKAKWFKGIVLKY